MERGSFKNKGSLGIAIEGDARLGNWYEVIELNPQKHRTSKLAAAKTFADWLLSSEGQDAIADASGALNNLLQALEANKSASNDDWQNAIETMLSLANDV